MEILATYIKTVTLYVVFINVIEMIMPSEKYSNFIRLFLGLVLMYIILKPIFQFDFNHNLDNGILANYENYINANSESIDVENTEKKQYELVTETFIKNKEKEIISFIESNFDYRVALCDLEVNIDYENYGQLNGLNLKLNKLDENIEIIAPISISENKLVKNIENEEILKIKKMINEVYNLSLTNINITIAD